MASNKENMENVPSEEFFSGEESISEEERAVKTLRDVLKVDNGSNTFGVGGVAWVIDSITERRGTVEGYDQVVACCCHEFLFLRHGFI